MTRKRFFNAARAAVIAAAAVMLWLNGSPVCAAVVMLFALGVAEHGIGD